MEVGVDHRPAPRRFRLGPNSRRSRGQHSRFDKSSSLHGVSPSNHPKHIMPVVLNLEQLPYRVRPVLTWTPPPTAPREDGGMERQDWLGPAAGSSAAAAIRHAPPRRHRHTRRLAHVTLGPPTGCRRPGSRPPSPRYRNRRPWASGRGRRGSGASAGRSAYRADGRSRPATGPPHQAGGVGWHRRQPVALRPTQTNFPA
jgi:hypothetical protein